MKSKELEDCNTPEEKLQKRVISVSHYMSGDNIGE